MSLSQRFLPSFATLIPFCVCSFVTSAIVWGQTTQAPSQVDDWLDDNVGSLVQVYRQLHAAPELSFYEEQTSKFMAQKWRALGAAVTPGVGGFGVVGIVENDAHTDGDGPTVMLRCDMDGLPVTEATNLVYSSTVRTKNEQGVEVGVMHACGHDMHMTCVLGAAQFLVAHPHLWRGRLMLIAQPAEERGAGAKAMLKDGLFERFPKPDYALAQHLSHDLPAGRIAYRGGYALANVDSVDITMKGRGGHGAYPDATIDPVVQAAELVMSLQTIVSREVKPIEPAVISVGSIHGGTKHNIIGDQCHLQLTVRSYGDKVRAQLLSAIQRKAKAVAAGARAKEPEIRVSEGTPSVFNDRDLVERLAPALRETLGEDNLVTADPVMGGEDFSQFGRAGVPICMLWLGCVEQKRLERFGQLGTEPPSLHSAEFYPDAELTLRTGVKAMTAAALELLAE